MIEAREVAEPGHVDDIVEVTDVVHDGSGLHFVEMFQRDDVAVAHGRGEDNDLTDDGVTRNPLEALNIEAREALVPGHADDDVEVTDVARLLSPHGSPGCARRRAGPAGSWARPYVNSN